MMDIVDIEIFLAIIEEKSILKAADSLYMSTSTVGNRLKMLEKELGFNLIERKKGYKEISPTSRGIEFISLAKDWMATWNDCLRLAQSTDTPFISIGTVDSMLAHAFIPLYQQIARKNPRFDIDIKCYPAHMIYSLVDKKMVDVGFALYKEKCKDICVEKVLDEEMVLVVPENSNIKGTNIHPSELKRRDELFIGWGPVYKTWHDKWFNNSIRPHISVTNISVLIHFLNIDNIWTIIPISNAMSLSKILDIRILHLSERPPNRICYKLTHSSPSSTTEKNIRNFDKFFASFIKSLSTINIEQ
jgi:DNA-binding transcriptional LysR family regulator